MDTPAMHPKPRTSWCHHFLLSVIFLACGNLTVHAQKKMDGLDHSLEPHFGTYNLSAGFDSDPQTIRIESGGSISISHLGLCSECEGYASIAPDITLNWTGNSDDLRIFFEADDPSEDATLIISTSDGTWVGNDDAHSTTLNPRIHLDGYGGGQYDIWVGSYSSGTTISGTLTITEYDREPAGRPVEDSPDYSLDPHFGTVDLSSGFDSDPHQIEVVSGGSVDVSLAELCSGCTGYVSRAPDIRLNWSGDTDDLRVFFRANYGGEDATLVISTPSGEWIGNDDAHDNTLDPMVILRGHGAGQYDIWVGSFSADETIEGVVTITELNRRP